MIYDISALRELVARVKASGGRNRAMLAARTEAESYARALPVATGAARTDGDASDRYFVPR